MFIPLLAHFTTNHLVPCAQDVGAPHPFLVERLQTHHQSPLLRCEDSHDAHSRDCIPYLVHRESSWNWSDHTSTFHAARLRPGLGHGDQYYVVRQQHGDTRHKRPGLRLPRTHSISRAVPTTIYATSNLVYCIFDWNFCELVITGDLW